MRERERVGDEEVKTTRQDITGTIEVTEEGKEELGGMVGGKLDGSGKEG